MADNNTDRTCFGVPVAVGIATYRRSIGEYTAKTQSNILTPCDSLSEHADLLLDPVKHAMYFSGYTIASMLIVLPLVALVTTISILTLNAQEGLLVLNMMNDMITGIMLELVNVMLAVVSLFTRSLASLGGYTHKLDLDEQSKASDVSSAGDLFKYN